MIIINKSETANSRTCDYKSVSKETLRNSTLSHIKDVEKTMQFFTNLMSTQASVHDSHKLYTIDWFYETFKSGFENKDWYNDHKKNTRHHLKDNQYLKEDVNLVDVFEYICDCVCAGLARSGTVYDLNIDEKILIKAFNNTVEILKKNITIED